MQMSVERVDVLDRSIFSKGVSHNDNVPPPEMHIAGEDHYAVTDTINWIPQIGVAATDSIPVFAHMATGTKSSRPVVTFGIRFTDGKIETISKFSRCCFDRSVHQLNVRRRPPVNRVA